MEKSTFERKRRDALAFVITDSTRRFQTALTNREENNALKRIRLASDKLAEYQESGFWNAQNTWIYENCYKDLPENTSVSAW